MPTAPQKYADTSAKNRRHKKQAMLKHPVGRSRHPVSGNGATHGHVYGSPLREANCYHKIHFEKYNEMYG